MKNVCLGYFNSVSYKRSLSNLLMTGSPPNSRNWTVTFSYLLINEKESMYCMQYYLVQLFEQRTDANQIGSCDHPP